MEPDNCLKFENFLRLGGETILRRRCRKVRRESAGRSQIMTAAIGEVSGSENRIPQCLATPFLVEWYAAHSDSIRYVCYGVEIAPDTGRKHHQCYLQLKRKQRFTAMKKLLGARVHIEASNGTPDENRTYCKKEGDFHEFGTIMWSGKRTDIDDAVDEIKSGKSRDAVVLDNPHVSIKYASGLRGYQECWERSQAKDDRVIETEVLFGPTGTGKTYYAIASGRADPGGYFMIKGADIAKGNWWDGYQGQSVLIIDEFFDGCMSIQALLSVLDRYPLHLSVKYSFSYAQWTKVFITTNQARLYDQEMLASKEALERRVTKTSECFSVIGLARLREKLRRIVGAGAMPKLTEWQRVALGNADTDDEMDSE